MTQTMERLVFRCAGCGGINRVPAERTAEGPVCGRCKAALDLEAHPVDVSDDDLQRLIASSPVPVLVDFHATWCGPCRMVAPAVTALAREHAGRLVVVKVDTDQHQRHASAIGLRGVPTFALWRDGQLVRSQSGALPKPMLERFITSD
jgi:thioredoxin 2